MEVDEPCDIEHAERKASDSSDDNDKDSEKLQHAEMAESMAVVDMGESCIRKIVPVSASLIETRSDHTGDISHS
jgi:hypothetical protein